MADLADAGEAGADDDQMVFNNMLEKQSIESSGWIQSLQFVSISGDGQAVLVGLNNQVREGAPPAEPITRTLLVQAKMDGDLEFKVLSEQDHDVVSDGRQAVSLGQGMITGIDIQTLDVTEIFVGGSNDRSGRLQPVADGGWALVDSVGMRIYDANFQLQTSYLRAGTSPADGYSSLDVDGKLTKGRATRGMPVCELRCDPSGRLLRVASDGDSISVE